MFEFLNLDELEFIESSNNLHDLLVYQQAHNQPSLRTAISFSNQPLHQEAKNASSDDDKVTKIIILGLKNVPPARGLTEPFKHC